MSRSTHYFTGSRDGKRPSSGDALDKAKDHYDVVVVGSGLAGLTAANILGRAGHSVCVLEQHYNFGGMATWFKRRGGHVFDISLHGFPIGMKKTCRKYWGTSISDRIVQLEGVRFDNPQFQFNTTFTREDFTHKLVDVFGCASRTVEAFYETLRAMNYYDDDGRTTAELFEEFFPGRNDVHRLLMEPISYANGSTLEDPAITYGIVFSNFMSKGVYTFTGGTDLLIREMRAILARNGVDVFGRSQVDEITVEHGRVRGVRVGTREIRAETVVSNAGLKATIERLVAPDHFDDAWLDAAKQTKLNCSSTQVYMGLGPGEDLPWIADLFFTSTRPEFDSASLADLHGQSRTFSFYYPKVRPGTGRHTVVSSMNANWSDWADLSESDYAAAKARLEEDTLKALEVHVPDIRSKVTHLESSTPRSFAFYTQHTGGASFGTKFEGLRYSMELPQQIEGLYHSGSVGIIMSGWLGAANYGAITANKVDARIASLAADAAPSS
ncbi:MAG: FAD-binding protein [Planctomycetota bacterium]|nr:FAD-binding protein [Planctomycetota bacterium]